MAHVATVTRTRQRRSGYVYHFITVVETGVVDGTSEYTIDNLPKRGTIVEHRCVLTAGDGTATTVDPEVGTATTTKEIFENGAAGASTVNVNIAKGFTANVLYARSGANGNTGTTGLITTNITLVEG